MIAAPVAARAAWPTLAAMAPALGAYADVAARPILEVQLAGNGHRVVASGLRNPNGTACEPRTAALRSAVNAPDARNRALLPDDVDNVVWRVRVPR